MLIIMTVLIEMAWPVVMELHKGKFWKVFGHGPQALKPSLSPQPFNPCISMVFPVSKTMTVQDSICFDSAGSLVFNRPGIRDFWITGKILSLMRVVTWELKESHQCFDLLEIPFFSCDFLISFPFSFEDYVKNKKFVRQLSTRRQVPVCGKYLHDCTLAVALSLRGLPSVPFQGAMKETSDTSDTSDDQPS